MCSLLVFAKLSSQNMNISGVVLTKNNEDIIARCLKSISFCNEIIIIDDYSDDNTTKIVRKFNAKIYKRHLNDNWAAQRNFGLTKTSGDWTLFVDSDEVVSKSLQKEIKRVTSWESKMTGYFVTRRDIVFGKKLKHGESGNSKLVRLAKKGSGKWKRRVHEYWNIKGRVGDLNGELVHYAHESISDFLTSVNRYSSFHARQNIKEGKRATPTKIILYPVFKFFNNYFLKRGFLDGGVGLIAAGIMSWHSFVSWSKMYLWQKN